MIDLNSLRVFQSVATLGGFSAAARATGAPKSSISRAIAHLESELGTRLIQRSTREFELTESGIALQLRCADILASIDETVMYIGDLVGEPRGLLRISAGIGFGQKILAEVLPNFLLRYPSVDLSVDLTSRSVDLISANIDVAIRMGPLPDSQLISTRLGTVSRFLCAAPSYLERRGTPDSVAALTLHDTVDMPGAAGRPRTWIFSDASGQEATIELQQPRVTVNDSLSLHSMVVRGAGIGSLASYLCEGDLREGRLVRLLPEWRMSGVQASIVFPSNRELSPTVRAFVDFLKTTPLPEDLWQRHD